MLECLIIDSNQYPGRSDQMRLVGEQGIITIPATRKEEKLENRTEGVTEERI